MVMKRPAVFLRYITLVFLLPTATSSSSVCDVFLFVPFTEIDGGGNRSTVYGLESEVEGFYHMAAGLMAEEQFNARDPSVVPNLASLDCNITLRISDTAAVFDSVLGSHVAGQTLKAARTPCAVVVSADDEVALELSTLALSNQYPIVPSKGSNVRLSYDYFNSFTSSVFPDMETSASALMNFLLHKGRNQYIALLYELGDTGNQRQEIFDISTSSLGIESFSTGYVNAIDPVVEMNSVDEVQLPLDALKLIKETGYRTIVVAMNQQADTFQQIADAVDHLGLNNGNYFFVFWDVFVPPEKWNANINASKLSVGSGWMRAVSQQGSEGNWTFLDSWRSQGEDLVNRLNKANPIEENEAGYMFAELDFFNVTAPDLDAAFVYDAVMSMGLGACNASFNQSGPVTGESRRNAILGLNFEGATGHVAFDSNAEGKRNTRQVETSTFAALNILENGEWVVTDFALGRRNLTWEVLAPFIYADGRDTPPLPLKNPPNRNYIDQGARAYGLAMMSFVIVFAVSCMVWVFVNRKHRIVTSSQAQFLYLICIGSIISISAIFALSFDEGAGWSEQMLDRSCMAVPWLLYVGHILTFSALFTKLWRVHKVLQFTRRRFELKQLVKPMITLIALTLILMALWTAISPLRWVRTTVNEVTGDSVGKCDSPYMGAFVIPLTVIATVPMIGTAFMAFKTRDVDEAFAESWWIFLMILCQLEAMLVAAPVAIILREQATGSTRYIVFVLLLMIVPLSTLSFMFMPKVITWYRLNSSDRQPDRGNEPHSGDNKDRSTKRPVQENRERQHADSTAVHSIPAQNSTEESKPIASKG
mmetsp:Transcript_10403/g.28745  ORF Transcript_10403/g.28745 Transcript_10403/m.28745 type:complete len:819 (-) Transcript_10403:813-3269(-)